MAVGIHNYIDVIPFVTRAISAFRACTRDFLFAPADAQRFVTHAHTHTHLYTYLI